MEPPQLRWQAALRRWVQEAATRRRCRASVVSDRPRPVNRALAVGRLLACWWWVVPVAALAAPQPAARPAPPGPAYLVLELPSRRVLAEARPDVLASAVAPGSLVKPITLAAALEAGVVSDTTRIACNRTIDLDGRRLTCVHPDLHHGLTPDEALALSCNVFFGTVARRLSRAAFDDMLVRLGLGPSSPRVPITQAAVGIDGVRASPRQWLDAFLRLTDAAPPAVRLKPATRSVLQGGLRQAATEGTAIALREAGLAGLAKTGTAPMPGGGVLGVVAATVDSLSPARAIIVVAPGASGAQAAELAARLVRTAGTPPRNAASAVPPAGGRRPIRVGRVGGGRPATIEAVELEDVVSQGVAGEGGDDLASAALEALAVTIRTVVVRSNGRHAGDGYDLCDLTHCVVLRPATARSRAAATATAGRVLVVDGRPAEVYFSADCGGHTERPSGVWPGASDPAHLPARPDDVCARRPGWQSELPEAQLRGVLADAGFRGGALETVRVTSRTASGRVRQLALPGMVPARIDGERFRLTIGRAVGWQVLKSAMFDVQRTGRGFRFAGRGFGHGVGLCVLGADARAHAGADLAAVLAFYFPGATVEPAPPGTRVGVRLSGSGEGRATEIRAIVDRDLGELTSRLAVDAPAQLDLVFHPTVEAFRRATGLPWWTGARTRGTRIDLLPADVLSRRHTLARTLRHELVHVLTDAPLAGRPLWVREGLARVLAGEADPAAPGGAASPDRCPSDDAFGHAASPETARAAYDRAARCVSRALARGVPWRDLR